MNTLTIRAARIVGPLLIELDWSTGETLRADLSAWLRPPFDALRDPATFAQMPPTNPLLEPSASLTFRAEKKSPFTARSKSWRLAMVLGFCSVV